ncbi:hypothetical protein GF373_16725 [bacterium]|nr:hypothetical protein [bacterium]
MKRIIQKISLIVVVLILLVLLWVAGSYSLVITEKETVWVEKEAFGFHNMIADTRDWSMNDYLDHPEITKTLVDRGYEDLAEQLKNSDLAKEFEQLFSDMGDIFKSLSGENNH